MLRFTLHDCIAFPYLYRKDDFHFSHAYYNDALCMNKGEIYTGVELGPAPSLTTLTVSMNINLIVLLTSIVGCKVNMNNV